MKKEKAETKLVELDKRVRVAVAAREKAENRVRKAENKRRDFFDKYLRCESKETFEYYGSHRFDLTHRCTKTKNHEGPHTGGQETWK